MKRQQSLVSALAKRMQRRPNCQPICNWASIIILAKTKLTISQGEEAATVAGQLLLLLAAAAATSLQSWSRTGGCPGRRRCLGMTQVAAKCQISEIQTVYILYIYRDMIDVVYEVVARTVAAAAAAAAN